MKSYVHRDIEAGAEVRFISGYYTDLEEMRLSVGDREVLCTAGVGILDNSCCGQGGCYFVEVPGYIVSWRNGVDGNGRPVSDVLPVEDEMDKQAIREMLQKLYPQAQVNFI
jgi:hypothetical protein